MTNNEIVARALANTGITALNEMQQAVLDAGTIKDMVLLSPTGSGKTLAFLLPLLTTLTDEDRKIQALIIAPSRELALQIETVLRSLGAGYKVNCCYGGTSADGPDRDTGTYRRPPGTGKYRLGQCAYADPG